jgi:hypothetical protein
MSSSDARWASNGTSVDIGGWANESTRAGHGTRASEGRWAELSSQNERLVPPEHALCSTDASPAEARPRWAELASQSERLADLSDPLFGLASSSHGPVGMRLVAGAA